jgi:hypothetical protein
VLIGDGVLVIVPTLHEIFNVAPGDPDRAHARRMNRPQLAGADQVPD